MPLVEAVLTYRPHGTGTDGAVAVGATADPRALRIVRDRLLEAAHDEARVWADVDPGLAEIKRAEARRLAQVLAVLLPDEDLRPHLRLVDADQQSGTLSSERDEPL